MPLILGEIITKMKLENTGEYNDRSIIYYSANTEELEFEQRIIEDLKKKAKDIPIISVTRKPIDLGINICVGEQPVCYTNEWRQLLIGLKAAKTKYCMTAESDCLYSEDYLTFTPPRDDTMYYYDNLYLVWKRHNGFWKKNTPCEGAEICNREYWISQLEHLLGNGWKPKGRRWESKIVKKFFPNKETFTGNGVITFKTGNGLSSRSVFINNKLREIPYWGNIKEIKNKYLWRKCSQ